MKTYLDIAAVRIQAYLTRWPSLVGRRAASALVADAFRVGSRGVSLPYGFAPHDEAGSPDGVLHLARDGEQEDDVADVARSLMLQIRDRLPAVEMEATWGQGESYAEAYADGMRPMQTDGRSLRCIPPLAEPPVVQRCTLSGVDLAVGTIEWHGTRAAGPDSLQRHHRAYLGGNPMPDDDPLPAPFAGRPSPDDFDALGRIGQRDDAEERDRSNHVATVFADGNDVGALFAGLRQQGRGRDDIVALSRGLKTVTSDALGAAVAEIDRGQSGQLPCIVHIQGGDDVLVSVPAHFAFRFVITYLRVFRDQAAELLGHIGVNGIAPPTASAGLVIAHSHFPIARAVSLADGLLSRAKRTFQGRDASFGWVDVTRHGEESPRQIWKVDALDQHTELLTTMKNELGKSLLTGLERHASASPEIVARARLRVEIARADLEEDTRTTLSERLGNDPGLFLELADIARWW